MARGMCGLAVLALVLFGVHVDAAAECGDLKGKGFTGGKELQDAFNDTNAAGNTGKLTDKCIEALPTEIPEFFQPSNDDPSRKAFTNMLTAIKDSNNKLEPKLVADMNDIAFKIFKTILPHGKLGSQQSMALPWKYASDEAYLGQCKCRDDLYAYEKALGDPACTLDELAKRNFLGDNTDENIVNMIFLSGSAKRKDICKALKWDDFSETPNPKKLSASTFPAFLKDEECVKLLHHNNFAAAGEDIVKSWGVEFVEHVNNGMTKALKDKLSTAQRAKVGGCENMDFSKLPLTDVKAMTEDCYNEKFDGKSKINFTELPEEFFKNAPKAIVQSKKHNPKLVFDNAAHFVTAVKDATTNKNKIDDDVIAPMWYKQFDKYAGEFFDQANTEDLTCEQIIKTWPSFVDPAKKNALARNSLLRAFGPKNCPVAMFTSALDWWTAAEDVNFDLEFYEANAASFKGLDKLVRVKADFFKNMPASVVVTTELHKTASAPTDNLQRAAFDLIMASLSDDAFSRVPSDEADPYFLNAMRPAQFTKFSSSADSCEKLLLKNIKRHDLMAATDPTCFANAIKMGAEDFLTYGPDNLFDKIFDNRKAGSDLSFIVNWHKVKSSLMAQIVIEPELCKFIDLSASFLSPLQLGTIKLSHECLHSMGLSSALRLARSVTNIKNLPDDAFKSFQLASPAVGNLSATLIYLAHHSEPLVKSFGAEHEPNENICTALTPSEVGRGFGRVLALLPHACRVAIVKNFGNITDVAGMKAVPVALQSLVDTTTIQDSMLKMQMNEPNVQAVFTSPKLCSSLNAEKMTAMANFGPVETYKEKTNQAKTALVLKYITVECLNSMQEVPASMMQALLVDMVPRFSPEFVARNVENFTAVQVQALRANASLIAGAATWPIDRLKLLSVEALLVQDLSFFRALKKEQFVVLPAALFAQIGKAQLAAVLADVLVHITTDQAKELVKPRGTVTINDKEHPVAVFTKELTEKTSEGVRGVLPKSAAAHVQASAALVIGVVAALAVFF